MFTIFDSSKNENELEYDKNNANESLRNCLNEKISFNKFIDSHIDLDEEPSELEEIDEGFDCVPTTSNKDQLLKSKKKNDFFLNNGKNEEKRN